MRTVEDKIKLGVFPGFKFSHCPGDLLFLLLYREIRFFFSFFQRGRTLGSQTELKILFLLTLAVSALSGK